MLTDEQIFNLTTIKNVHEALFEWCRKHAVEIPYEELTALQKKTLVLIAKMSKEEQRQYVIIDDMLVKTPTKVKYYSKSKGKWHKRQLVKANYNNRK